MTVAPNGANESEAEPLPVFLVHYDAPDWVRSAAQSILRSDLPVVVTVINNGPQTELSIDGVEVVTLTTNAGFAGGANSGLGLWLRSSAPYCVVGAHDLHVGSGTLSRLVAAARDHGDFGVLAPRVDPSGVGRLIAREGDLEERSWVSGTCMLLRRECIQQVGGFDPDFRSYTEDRELCYRAAKHGWRVGRLLSASAHGLGSRVGDASPYFLSGYVLLDYKTGGPVKALRTASSHMIQLARSAPFALLPTARGARHRRVMRFRLTVLLRAWQLLRRASNRRGLGRM